LSYDEHGQHSKRQRRQPHCVTARKYLAEPGHRSERVGQDLGGHEFSFGRSASSISAAKWQSKTHANCSPLVIIFVRKHF